MATEAKVEQQEQEDSHATKPFGDVLAERISKRVARIEEEKTRKEERALQESWEKLKAHLETVTAPDDFVERKVFVDIQSLLGLNARTDQDTLGVLRAFCEHQNLHVETDQLGRFPQTDWTISFLKNNQNVYYG